MIVPQRVDSVKVTSRKASMQSAADREMPLEIYAQGSDFSKTRAEMTPLERRREASPEGQFHTSPQKHTSNSVSMPTETAKQSFA